MRNKYFISMSIVSSILTIGLFWQAYVQYTNIDLWVISVVFLIITSILTIVSITTRLND